MGNAYPVLQNNWANMPFWAEVRKIAIPSLVTQFARWPWHDFNLRLVREKRRKPRRAEERGRLSIVLSSLDLVGMGAFGSEMRPCHPKEMNLIPNNVCHDAVIIR